MGAIWVVCGWMFLFCSFLSFFLAFFGELSQLVYDTAAGQAFRFSVASFFGDTPRRRFETLKSGENRGGGG